MDSPAVSACPATVAIAAPAIPKWQTKISSGSSTRFAAAPASVATIANVGLPSERMTGFIACPKTYSGTPKAIQKKYSCAFSNVPALTRPPNHVSSVSGNSRYAAIRTSPATTLTVTVPPTARWDSSCFPAPSIRLTNAQQPSPSMTAIASAATVSGKTTVVAALPTLPKSGAFAMNT